MDERGFIFTTDATLALIVLIVFSASIITYYMLPTYMGEDHQHLEALADDILETMYQDGTLYAAAVKYAANNTTGAENILTTSLNALTPEDVAYKMTLSNYPSVRNDKGVLSSRDVVTRVKTISGPREGWMGRAWFKVEEVNFTDQSQNETSTLWNFHNWLSNFQPWQNYGLYSRPYWGGGSSPQNIAFSIPGANITAGKFLLGSDNRYNGSSYGANVVINGHSYSVEPNQFTYLYNRPGANTQRMYNYQGLINATDLSAGVNNFNVNFRNMSSQDTNRYDMPWFSLLGSYTTSISVPQGVLNQQYSFPDAAGLAIPDPQDLNGSGQANQYGRIYDLNTGSVTSFTDRRVMPWSDFVNNRNTLDGFDDGIPFVIDNVNGEDGSAVSVVQDINIPIGSRIFDGYVNINAYGGVDNALVEVWDGTSWRTAFCSFNFDGQTYSSRTDGYGNTPGRIYIGDRLHTGNNKVRVTIWDQVPSTDYDLVGLVNCYSVVTYSYLPIRWDTFPFSSYQAPSSSNTYTFPNSNGRQFTIGSDATKVYMFVGTGTTSRHLKVDVWNSTAGWATLYDSDTIPYSLDLAALDAAGPHRFTKGTAGNYTLNQGTFRSRVTVTSPLSWESGDGASNPGTYGNPVIFSGTRIAVLYPKFLQNAWAASYSNDPVVAQDQARTELVNLLAQSGIIIDPNDPRVHTEALYTGNLPNTMPVRLDLWRG